MDWKDKSRIWEPILYPENMLDDWESRIEEITQYPLAYAIHDKDVDELGQLRKPHVHMILSFPNTTTRKHALNVANRFSRSGCTCCSSVADVDVVRSAFDYLVHDTDDCRKKGKYLYYKDGLEPICKNNFDIGFLEQFDAGYKRQVCSDLTMIILSENICNAADFLQMLYDRFSDQPVYFETWLSYSAALNRVINGVYQKLSKSSDKNK